MRIRLGILAMGVLLAGSASGGWFGEVRGGPPTVVKDFTLEGRIDGENITFALGFGLQVNERDVALPLVMGDTAYLDGQWPSDSELTRDGESYVLKLKSRGESPIRFVFASRPEKDGDWRRTNFRIPSASIRKLAVVCDRDDLEIVFPGALNVTREKNAEGRTVVTAYLGIVDRFQVGWKPEVKKLDGDLVVACEGNTIAAASVGAMRMDTVFTYRVIQGALNRISLLLPDVNITQVRGEDVQDWRIDRTDKEKPRLVVTLGRPKEELYRLQVESEVVLPKFPCKTALPLLMPENAIRSGGFLMIGTDSAIKLQVNRAAGLTQVDPASFPTVALDAKSQAGRRGPARTFYTYQYASMPFALELTADDIVTTCSADDRLVLSMQDNDLTFQASVELDIRDAPAREVVFELDPDADWTVTSVRGKNLSEPDTDVREEKGRRLLYVPFKQAVVGPVLVDIRMERTWKGGATNLVVPAFRVQGAKLERGYLVLASGQGIRLKAQSSSGLREVHIGSAPMQVPGAQQAFRFREPGWRVTAGIEKSSHAVHCEAFHLVSLGEGLMYCSAALSYHISGAPVQEFKVVVPPEVESVEFTGADIEGWTRTGGVAVVRLQTKVMGDYTLLATYDRQFPAEGGILTVGGILATNVESEVGYLAVASSASLKVEEAGPLPASLIRIEKSELPPAYALPVADPILAAFKYTRAPRGALLRVEPFVTERLLGQVADYVKLDTTLSTDGETVTQATYFLKNASRQHLVVRLPEGVNLWSVKYVDEDGLETDALSQTSKEGLLVPVRRPQDPNTPLQVLVTYAESHGKLDLWRAGLKGLRLTPPLLPDTHASFVKWRVTLPAGYAIGHARGLESMEPEGGLVEVYHRVVRLLKALADGPNGIRLGRVLAEGTKGGGVREFTRVVELAGSPAPTLEMTVVPGWIGPGGSLRGLLALLGLGGVVLAVGRRPVSAGRKALLWTLLVCGVAEASVGCSLLATLLVVGAGFCICWFAVRKVLWGCWLALRALAVTLFWRVPRAVAVAVAGLCSRRRDAGPVAADDEPSPFEEDVGAAVQPDTEAPKPPAGPGDGQAGWIGLRLLVWTATLIGAVGVCHCLAAQIAPDSAARQGEEANAAAGPLMDQVTLSIVAPGTGRDVEQSAAVSLSLEFRTEGEQSFVLLPRDCVLVDFKPDSRTTEVRSDASGYSVVVHEKGKHRIDVSYRVPTTSRDGQWSVTVPLLRNMRNKVVLRVPEAGMEVTSDLAILFKTTEPAGATEVEAVFGPAASATFHWHPRVRKTQLEETVYYCEVNTRAEFQSGVVEVHNALRYQIAQGEIKEVRLKIPAGMSVTTVRAPGMATWSFDPDKRVLEAILEKAVSGELALWLVTQIPCEGLPYTAALGVPEVLGAARQRGAVVLAAPETVQVRVEDVKGLNPMNIEDFPAESAPAGDKQPQPGRKGPPATLRKAFRYHEAQNVSVSVATERVWPEVRVVEAGTLSIADERIVLATRLDLAIAKAGLFAVELSLPVDFDVETLTGPDVSHWDETRSATNRAITVHFNRQVNDQTVINIVVARSEKGIERLIVVPRVAVTEACKHSGRLTVSGERGVRLVVESHRGVDIRKASEEGIRQAGVLVFDILRPGWEITLATELMAAQVKADVLQLVDLAEGMLQHRAHVRYAIENAGAKVFRLRAPAPGVTLSVSGRNVARVSEVNKEQGVWQVELSNKVEDNYALTVTCQQPYDPAEHAVRIAPILTQETESQRGYVVVTCGSRVQIKQVGEAEGLKVEDARNVPLSFGAGDLSGAVACYRILRPDFGLELSVVRHDAARVLPASIRRMGLRSVVSANGVMLTSVGMELTIGGLRFLKTALPDDGNRLWTVQVNGKPVVASRDGAYYCIPLEEQDAGEVTVVDFVYAGLLKDGGWSEGRLCVAPKFAGLPVENVEWSFFVQPSMRFAGFGGTMDPVNNDGAPLLEYDDGRYWARNRSQREANVVKARQVLDAGEELVKAGQQVKARQAFQQAMNYSQGQADLNEDARVQLRNLTKQQVKMGLLDRRSAVRFRNNVVDETHAAPMEGFKGGNFSQEYVQRIENALTVKDNDALEVVADKMIEQQAAAAGVVKAIEATVPEHGRRLSFFRRLQVDPAGDVTVVFHAFQDDLLGPGRALLPAGLMFVGLWAVLGLVQLRRK